MEEWKPTEFENYEVSNLGKVRNIKRQYVLSAFMNNGYLYSGLCVNGKALRRAVHRLVATAFVPKEKSSYVTNHKNGVKTDNRAENLEWVSQKQNIRHSIRTGLSKVRMCPIVQYDKEGREITRFDSIKDMEDTLGFDRSLIIRVCKGRGKTAYGYIWKYAKESHRSENVLTPTKGKVYCGYSKYLVLPDGKVYSKTTCKYLKPVVNKNKHCYVTFSNKGKKKNFYIHTMVATLFLDNPEKYSTVIHMNGVKGDNRVENLKWVKKGFNKSLRINDS